MDGGARKTLRTYARRQPQHKIQLQNWLTPPIRQQHIFSSSSSSALSSSVDHQDSSDPDFQPATKRLRKLSVADSRNVARSVAKPTRGKKGLKKTKCISRPKKRIPRKGRGAAEEPTTNHEETEDLHNEEKENSIPEVKKSFIFGTPQNNFITKRRRAAALKNRCPPSSGKNIQSFFKQVRLTPLSVKRPAPSGRKILHSPGELRLAPRSVGQPSNSDKRTDSSPREVYVVPINDHSPRSRKRYRNPTRKALSEVQRSQVRLKPYSGSSADFQTFSKKRLTRRQAQLAAASMASTFDSGTSPRRRPIRKPPLLSSTPSAPPILRPYHAMMSDCEVSFDEHAEEGVLHSELHSFGGCCLEGHPTSARRLSPKGAPSSIFSDSKSVICISRSTPGKSYTQPISKNNTQGTPSIFCLSPELFTPIADSPSQSIKKTVVRLERLSLRGFQRNPSYQPVVALNSDAVSRYFLTCKGNPTRNGHDCRQSANYLDKDRPTSLIVDTDVSSGEESLGKTPSSNIKEQSTTSLQLDGSAVRLQQQTNTSEKGLCGTLPSENVVGAGTGRKVCISGFSSKRWGNRTRTVDGTSKTNKTNMQLSFGNHYSNASESMICGLGWRKRKEEVVTALALGDSIEALKSVLSMDLLDDSFLNSSAVQNLSSSFSLQDNRHYARLRAALSLHKKKKVEIETRTADQEVDHVTPSVPSTPYSQFKPLGIFKTPAGQRLAMQLPTSKSSMCLLSPLVSTSFYGEVITDAEKVYEECMQDGPISFTSCISPQKMQKCAKIGEGVFGEVFRTISNGEHVALKIIPIEGSEKVNGESQKSFGEILPEIIISKELSLLCEEEENNTVGFIKLHSVHCVKGSYPKHLLQAWDKYDRDKSSENDRPDLFGPDQLFIILEFEFGGSDLENMRNELASITSAKSILHQVTAALAVAEEALAFEHRDLHWGNILVKKTNQRTIEYTLNGSTFQIPTYNIETNIIDYTLSRLEKDGLTVFCDISADMELFQGEGDYQYEMYRLMKEENGNSWSNYHPHSNVLWLHYVADKLINDIKYKKKPNNPATRSTHKKLLDFHDEVLTFRSAKEVLHKSSLFQ